MKIYQRISGILLLTASAPASPVSDNCQMASLPQFFVRTVTWDSSTPYETALN